MKGRKERSMHWIVSDNTKKLTKIGVSKIKQKIARMH